MSHLHPVPSQSLLDLLNKAGVDFSCKQSLDAVRPSGISDDSRRIGPDTLFVAVKGMTHDGHDFILQAVDSGAAAVLLSDARFIDDRVPCALVADAQRALAKLASTITGLSSIQKQGRLPIVGVTGTNGKTTTCHLIRHILQTTGRPTALLGTVQYDLIGRRIPAPWTTPPAIPLAEHLVEAHRHGAQYVVMEVSSHALTQRRTDGVQFAVGVFTNLSGDHLDYHNDKSTYGRAKKLLFDQLPRTGNAVINADDPVADELTADCPSCVTTFGLECQADVSARAVKANIHASRFVLVARDREDVRIDSAAHRRGSIRGRRVHKLEWRSFGLPQRQEHLWARKKIAVRSTSADWKRRDQRRRSCGRRTHCRLSGLRYDLRPRASGGRECPRRQSGHPRESLRASHPGSGGVDHGVSSQRELIEQQFFCAHIGALVVVVVQMISTQVCEHPDRELNAVRAALSQCVAGDFHDDSRRIGPGTLFVAVKGMTHDGHDFILQAVDSGAAAVLLSE